MGNVTNVTYGINDTFRTEDIGTFKEVHCEVKKCDVNAFAAVGGEYYIDREFASREQRYHGDLGSKGYYITNKSIPMQS